MTLPKPLYEGLPVLYVVSGIVTLFTLESWSSFVAGVLLGVAGIAILFMRRNFRQHLTLNSLNN